MLRVRLSGSSAWNKGIISLAAVEESSWASSRTITPTRHIKVSIDRNVNFF
jgi:hypothetical protein